MAEINTVAVDLHVKRYSDFDLLRLAKAASQDYDGLVTAFLVDVHIYACSAIGVVFSHIYPGPYQRFADGRLIRTSDIGHSVCDEARQVLGNQHGRLEIRCCDFQAGRRTA